MMVCRAEVDKTTPPPPHDFHLISRADFSSPPTDVNFHFSASLHEKRQASLHQSQKITKLLTSEALKSSNTYIQDSRMQ